MIKSNYFEYKDNINNYNNGTYGVDIWSLGVIMSFMFSFKYCIINMSNFYELKSEDCKIDKIEYLTKFDIIEVFYRQSKILPENLFKNIDNNFNAYLKAFVVGIIRYEIKERPNISEIINNLEILSNLD